VGGASLGIPMPVAQQVQNIKLRLRVIVEPDEDGFHAYCPAFKGLHVDGASAGEALQNAGEAALVYLNSLTANQEPLPIGPDCVLDREEQIPPVPQGAMLHDLELQWPSLQMSGIK